MRVPLYPDTYINADTVKTGQRITLDTRRTGPQPATAAELDVIASHYADTMRARGFTILEQDMVAIRRAAGIQDAWRFAFAAVLK